MEIIDQIIIKIMEVFIIVNINNNQIIIIIMDNKNNKTNKMKLIRI